MRVLHYADTHKMRIISGKICANLIGVPSIQSLHLACICSLHTIISLIYNSNNNDNNNNKNGSLSIATDDIKSAIQNAWLNIQRIARQCCCATIPCQFQYSHLTSNGQHGNCQWMMVESDSGNWEAGSVNYWWVKVAKDSSHALPCRPSDVFDQLFSMFVKK